MGKEFLFVAAFALVLRILLIPLAWHGDLNNNSSWGVHLLERGPKDFYEGLQWDYSSPNQPPLYVGLFSVIEFLFLNSQKFVVWANDSFRIFPSKVIWWYEQSAESYFLKSISILSDFGIAYLIFLFTKRKSLVPSAIWLLNPIVIYNSAVWGGTDSIVGILGLFAFYLLIIRKKLMLATAVFTLSLLFKGSLLYLAPLFLAISISHKYSIKRFVMSGFLSLILICIVCFPFHPHLDVPVWFFNLYTQKFLPGEIGYLTANAFNFWWIVDSGKTLDAELYFGISARLWGFVITFSALSLVIYNLLKKQSEKRVVMFLAFSCLLVFMFMTRIHERYLYPFFIFSTILIRGYKELFFVYCIFSLIHLLNLYNMFWAPSISILEMLLLHTNLPQILSAGSLILTVFLAFRTFYSKKWI